MSCHTEDTVVSDVDWEWVIEHAHEDDFQYITNHTVIEPKAPVCV